MQQQAGTAVFGRKRRKHSHLGTGAHSRPATRRTQCVLHYGMGHGSAFQMSRAYSAMVRSLENFPELATFRMALRAHSPGFAYNAPAASCARQYEVRSARCM